MLAKKIHFAYLLLIFFLSISCSSDDDASSADQVRKEDLLGKWNWVKSTGGMDGVTEHNPEKDGYTLQYHFKENDTVLITRNEETVYQKTTYLLTKEESILFHEEYPFLTIDFIFYDEDHTRTVLHMRYIINEVNRKQLLLTEDVFDGYGWVFEKG